ncbi:MAG TPA: CopG family antitoxin, partial [Candidatus Dormibacteraeota bacterium]
MTTARFPDPYEGLSDDELDRHFSELIADNRQRQRSVSIRFPDELLEELRQIADQLGVRYQTLIKRLLEQDVARLRAHR